MEILILPTGRGFLRGDFLDYNEDACSIQESSITTKPLLWLGANTGNHLLTGECLARMHLTQEMAAALIPLLQRFVETGELK